MSDDIDQAAADFGLGIIDRLSAWTRWTFGPPTLDLAFEGDREPYLMTDGVMDARGRPVYARWYRVGVVNRSQVAFDAVEVTAEQLSPPRLPGLPQPLHWQNDNPAPGTAYQTNSSVPPGRKPSKYVDVVVHRPDLDDFELKHITPGVKPFFPKGRYDLVLQVRAEVGRPRRRTFRLDLDHSGELRFRRAPS